MKTSELKTKSRAELEKLISESRGKLSSLRFQAAAGKLKDVREIREVRKDIAHMLTVMKGI
ncbi:MAG: 50S ribosomal protein L29 [Candidatus Wildermuthbacteria bacterium]|nr:50S ribosomal protein L29 [Candidatus Wildermuthbacteria bacterium]